MKTLRAQLIDISKSYLNYEKLNDLNTREITQLFNNLDTLINSKEVMKIQHLQSGKKIQPDEFYAYIENTSKDK